MRAPLGGSEQQAGIHDPPCSDSGPPQPSFEIGTGIAVEDDTPVDANGRTAKQRDQETRRLRQRYSRSSKVGLAFVFLGFLFQLWATWA